MKKVLLFLTLIFLYSCSSTKAPVKKPLYEVLVVNNDGGANIKFYEILTEPKEIMMLLGDETLRKLIHKGDTTNSSFVILNAGPTKEPYNRIKIEKVVETPTQIEIQIKDTQKNLDPTQTDENTAYPYTILKVNSKKTIVIK
ncbi:hypothetical protein EZL74_08655 [Flavobacterium silvisoli]|uniref:Protease complex subunit PrcB family protein n=1 Tax=Flavobacterium silvisoli TaxID=2529433 RepID=A0A4Q9Z3H1_9FLAO|nr:hypothetical protein [Flavobacterium silvisoli]TBX68371.1 hypothetical protein EZL74_08655 [Flavobacterium silvisoli]